MKAHQLWVLPCLIGFALLSVKGLADPLKGGVEEQGFNGMYQQGYPAPAMVPTLNGGANSNAMMGRSDVLPQYQSRPPLMGTTSQSVALPPVFMGAWNVQGQRIKVVAMPEFQAGAERAFAGSTSNIWQISGNPQMGYSMSSNTGIQTALVVDKVENGTAYMRYQHPIGNTTAQEAIVMTLSNGGVQFNGLERVSIVKQGLPQPRAQVTYQLVGHRQ
jgi:hypothetical protein